MKKILGLLRNTIDENNLINDGETIGIGISGGKDSMSLLYELNKYSKFSNFDFKVHAVKINLGLETKKENQILRNFCKKINVPLTIKETDIKKIVFDIREEKNPCSLCSNMKRGALATTLNELGIKKLALGHHKNDKIETFFMNMFFSGRLNTFKMKSYLSRQDITVIRPFYEVEEWMIKKFIEKFDIPIITSNCPVDKDTKREEVKEYLNKTYKEFRPSKKSIENSLKNKDQFNLF